MKEYRDYYFNKAKSENYPARSVYKLQEIDAKYKIFRQGMKVLDLGASPGSWSLFAARQVGVSGHVISCDLQPANAEFPSHVDFFQQDVFERTPDFERILESFAPFDVVMSDMAPQTTGAKFVDQARSLNLCLEAFDVAICHLAKGASFIVKIFMGPDINDLVTPMRQFFGKVTAFKPQSSRAESKEIFYVGLGFKGQPTVQKT